MAFALAACHQARGACAVPGLAERGFSMDAHTHRLSPSRLQHSLLLVALSWLLPALPRSEAVLLPALGCMKSHQTWKRSRGGPARPGTAFFLPNFPNCTEHKGVSEGEFPLLLHSHDLKRRKGSLPQCWVPRRAGGVPCPGCEPIRDSRPLHGADPDRGRGLGPLCHTLPQ